MICDLCDAGKHRRCGGRCSCALCPVVVRGVSGPVASSAATPRRSYYVPTGTPRGPQPGTSSLSAEDQERVEAGLRRGESLSSIACRLGISRDKARTIKKRMELECVPA